MDGEQNYFSKLTNEQRGAYLPNVLNVLCLVSREVTVLGTREDFGCSHTFGLQG